MTHLLCTTQVQTQTSLKDLLQEIDLCDFGGWLGKSEIHRAGCQEGWQTGILGHMLKL